MSPTNDAHSSPPAQTTNTNTGSNACSHSPPPAPAAPNVPPTGAPPRYTRYMTRYAMRWPLVFSAAVGLIWAVAMGVYSLRDMGNTGETAKMKIFDLLLGILYFVVAAVEAFCIVVAVVQKPKFGKTLKIAAPVGVAVAVVAQIIAIVAHFTCKSALIDQCTSNTTGATEIDRFGNMSPVDDAEAKQLCENSFDRATWGVFAWLVVVSLLAIFFAGIALSYQHQLLAPPAPMNQSFPLQNYPPPPHQTQAQQGYWGPPPSQQQNWMVPPYPGPPPPGQEPYEKSDYQPDAEWAQAGYAPPPGPPPGASRSTNVDHGEHREEEEAWERARTEGVTAHLTGHGTAPRRNSGEVQGYATRNVEEDEAWERARGEGVTAHLTGHNKPRRDGDVV